MSSPVIFHSQNMINCHKIINQLIQEKRYIKYYNKYLVPYICNTINHEHRLINGRFIHPMWNVLERRLITGGGKFNYSYLKGADFTLEVEPTIFKNYHVYGKTFVYANAIVTSDLLLHPNSVLLFSIDKDIAEPLINHNLF